MSIEDRYEVDFRSRSNHENVEVENGARLLLLLLLLLQIMLSTTSPRAQ